MKSRAAILAIQLAVVAAFAACAPARGQVAPSAFGASARFDYDLSYSQTASFYSAYGETQQRGIVSGELQYLNGKPHSPLSLTYSGGYMFGISGWQSQTGAFQHLRLSQGYFERKWGLNVSDDVSYSPETPTTGFSGIPGVGGLPGLPDAPTGTILNSRMLYNTAAGTFTRSLDHDTSISVDGNYMILRYPTGAARETNNLGVRPEITWRLNALNSLSIQYSYSRFTYADSPFSMDTQSVQPGLVRIWNRRLTTGISAGPEFINSNSASVVPPSTGIAASGWAKYETKPLSVAANYYREVSTGAGYTAEIGVHNDHASASASHTFGRNLTLSGTGSYIHTQGLLQTGGTTAEYGGASTTRQLGEFISATASYTAIEQSSTLAVPANAISGLYQVIAFSIAYHPRENHIFKK